MSDKKAMESRGYYIWKLIKTYLICGCIYLVLLNLIKDDKDIAVIIAMAPFGLNIVERIIPFGFIGNFGVVLMLWALKIFLAGIIGWIACPITTIYYIVKIIKAKQC